MDIQMRGVCSRHREKGEGHRVLAGEGERRYLEDQGIDGRIILK
jgi:hypothetical protein